jgi:hypothetical protein
VGHASAPFYTSGTFWAIAGVAAVIVVGVATVWVTLRVSNPKRRLLYSMPVATPLLNRRPGLPADIEVRRKGQEKPLENPHVVTVQLVSRGRLDIQRDAFDDGKPLRLDVGAPIIECLDVTTSPPDRAVPPCKPGGSTLLVGPALIGRRQTIRYSLLVDGPDPRLSPPIKSLADVDIRAGDPGSEPLMLVPIVLLCSSVALLIIVLLAAPHSSNSVTSWYNWAALLVAVPPIALVAFRLNLWFDRSNR